MNADERAACEAAEWNMNSRMVHVGHIQQIVGCVLGIVSCAYFALHADSMPMLFGAVTKLLIRLMIVVVVIHNLFDLIFNVWHETLRVTYTDPCQLTIRRWKCVVLRAPMLASIASLTAIYALLLADRALELLVSARHYKQLVLRSSNTIILSFLLIYGSIFAFWLFHDEDFMQLEGLCATNSDRNRIRVTIGYSLLFAVDTACTIGFSVLLRHSTQQLARDKHAFDLERKVRLRNNVASLRFLTSGILLRALFVGTFLLGSCLQRILIPDVTVVVLVNYTAPLYTIQWYGCALACQLYFWRLFRVAHTRLIAATYSDKTRREIHFDQLNRQWSV